MEDTAHAAVKRRALKDRNGCTVCRHRKVKCDGRESGCLNCERLSFKCSLSNPSNESSLDILSTRRRVRQACEFCKTNKLRCSGTVPQCERCNLKGLGCIYRHRRAPSQRVGRATIASESTETSCKTHVVGDGTSDTTQAPATGQPHTTQIMGLDASKLIVQQHIDAFFQYVYVVGPFNFIHRGSFLRTWHNGKMAKSLICAVVGVASRFINLDTTRQDCESAGFPSNAMDEAERIVLQDIRHTTIPKLQILLLLIYDRTMSGDLSAVWHLTALASRNAFGLQLNNPIDIIPFTNQECRRRLMWCTYIMDKFSTGTTYPTLCPRETMQIQLPCDSRSFELEFEGKNPTLKEVAHSLAEYSNSSNLGITAYLIRVLDLRDQIRTFIDGKRESSAVNSVSWANDPLFSQYQDELAAFANNLPPDMQDSGRALYIRANTAESDVYIMVQGWLRVSWCELLREASIAEHSIRTGPQEPQIPSFAHSCAEQLMRQALRLTQFLKTMADLQTPLRKFFVTDWGIASCTMEVTKALLHCAELSSDNQAQDSIKSALALNFDLLGPLSEISQFVASWRDEMIYFISRSPYADIVEHPILGTAKRNLTSESVLTEARRAENARFPRHAAFRQGSQATANSVPASQSQVGWCDPLGGQSADVALSMSGDWMLGADLNAMLDVGTGEMPTLDVECLYAEASDGLLWDLPFSLV